MKNIANADRPKSVAAMLPPRPLRRSGKVAQTACNSDRREGKSCIPTLNQTFADSRILKISKFRTFRIAGGRPIDDIREVSNYVDAMMYGLERLAELPLSLRLIREMHARLLRSGRAETKNPGEFRRTQNWVGGTRPGNALFVPRLSWNWTPAWTSLNASFM